MNHEEDTSSSIQVLKEIENLEYLYGTPQKCTLMMKETCEYLEIDDVITQEAGVCLHVLRNDGSIQELFLFLDDQERLVLVYGTKIPFKGFPYTTYPYLELVPYATPATMGKKAHLVVEDNQVVWTICRASLMYTFTFFFEEIENVITFSFSKQVDSIFYGLGAKTGSMNRNGRKHLFYNTDEFDSHTEATDALYTSAPYLIGDFSHTQKHFYSVYHHTFGKTSIDCLNEKSVRYTLESFGKIIITLDESIHELLRKHHASIETMILPKRRLLSYQQSRHTYPSSSMIETMIHQFHTDDFPLSAVYLDIGYLDSCKVGTVNTLKFDFDHLVTTAQSYDCHIVPIMNPGVKREEGYELYDRLIHDDVVVQKSDGTYVEEEVWPGVCVFPDVLHYKSALSYGSAFDMFLHKGITTFWLDMNEPSVFHKTSKTLDPESVHRYYTNTTMYSLPHESIHNVYGYFHSKRVYEYLTSKTKERIFLLSRSGYVGSNHYATLWTGDNRSSWDHYRMAIPMLLNMSLSGFPNCGVDVGGFMNHVTDELLIRFTQLGVFFPFMRNHNSINQRYQEPIYMVEHTKNILRKAIHLREILVPYLYQAMHHYRAHYELILQPMFLHTKHHEDEHDVNTSFFFGSSIVVAPILFEGERYRYVYLPEGKWYYDVLSRSYKKGGHVVTHAPLDCIPFFIQEDSLLPREHDDILSLYVYAIKGIKTYFIDDEQTRDAPITKLLIHHTDQGFHFKMEGDQSLLKTRFSYLRLVEVHPEYDRAEVYCETRYYNDIEIRVYQTSEYAFLNT